VVSRNAHKYTQHSHHTQTHAEKKATPIIHAKDKKHKARKELHVVVVVFRLFWLLHSIQTCTMVVVSVEMKPFKGDIDFSKVSLLIIDMQVSLELLLPPR
jgi:hypothetical protein